MHLAFSCVLVSGSSDNGKRNHLETLVLIKHLKKKNKKKNTGIDGRDTELFIFRIAWVNLIRVGPSLFSYEPGGADS